MMRIKRQVQILLIFLLLFFSQREVAMSKVEEIQLPEPIKVGKVSLEEAILKRRSQREFMQKDLELSQISQLLWAAQGITGQKWGYRFRTTPSAGALYPMEIYVVSKQGLFHYLPIGHKLELLSQKDLRSSLAGAALGQTAVEEAAIDIVICGVYERMTEKYGKRGIRYVHIEAGHVAQNIHLQAVALGLGSVPIGAFSDEEVKNLLSLQSDHEPLYIIPVGYPRK
jgi:SagB-type dehydrogenase family enzyme